MYHPDTKVLGVVKGGSKLGFIALSYGRAFFILSGVCQQGYFSKILLREIKRISEDCALLEEDPECPEFLRLMFSRRVPSHMGSEQFQCQTARLIAKFARDAWKEDAWFYHDEPEA